MTLRAATLTYLALLALLAITVGSTFVPLGAGNSLVNLGVALAKAALIGALFMHLRRSGPLIILSVGVLIFGLCLLYGLTLNDYRTR
jgi:cytochrome c oxidase subunit 4